MPSDLDDSTAHFPEVARVVKLMAEGEFARGLEELGSLLDSSDPELRPRAFLILGRLNEARRDWNNARLAYEIAASSGHPEVAPFAGLMLAGALLELDQQRHAVDALKQAARAADPKVRDAAEAALRALHAQSDLPSARVVRRR